MVGGLTPNEIPEAIFLESGDIVLMTGGSRLRYHGVPKIMRAKSQPWSISQFQNSEPVKSKNTFFTLGVSNVTMPYENETRVSMNQVQDHEFWQPFSEYINEARINLNVRQVN